MSVCCCRGGPTCCKNVQRTPMFTVYHGVLADWSAEQFRLSSQPAVEEWDWEQRCAEYQGA